MTAQPAGAAMSASAWSVAPFDPEVAARLRDLIARLDAGQRMWLSGYLAGTAGAMAPAASLAAAPGAVRLAPAAVAEPATPAVTILYGSQSGNGAQLAERLAARLGEAGIAHRKLDMLDCRKVDLESAQVALVIVSTHGEGDPPDHAVELHEALHGRSAWKLAHVRFSVLALGDSSYERFCETGRQFDKQLETLGAQRLEARVDCDVDFEAAAAQWMDAVVEKIAAEATPAARPHADIAVPTALARPSAPASAHTRKNPFAAEVLVNQRITARGSTKDVRHIELALEGSHIHYEPGDSLGVVVRNRPADVDALLEALALAADAEVSLGDAELPLRTALLERLDIGPLTAELVRRYAAAADSASLADLTANAAALEAYVAGRDLLDLAREHALSGVDAQTFVGLLRPLAPRLYSIASSPAMHAGEAHLTVAVTRLEAHGRERVGLASGWLAEAAAGGSVPIFLQRNMGFRLPADPSAAIIMIGAGTGVAPYRGFLAEREAAGARGRNWLVFGDRTFELDFLYQAEWLAARKRGTLARLDVAFSRDQRDKIYVQHRLLEHGAEVWRWLEDGAYLYVCGDATHMAPDVEDALLAIARRHGGHDRDGANDWLLDLKRARRYQRDVY